MVPLVRLVHLEEMATCGRGEGELSGDEEKRRIRRTEASAVKVSSSDISHEVVLELDGEAVSIDNTGAKGREGRRTRSCDP